MQVAIKNCVFLIDMDRLPAAVESADVWLEFRTKILEKDQTKIFYSALQDLQMMWATVPELRSAGEDVVSYPRHFEFVKISSLISIEKVLQLSTI